MVGFDWNDLPVSREFDCKFLKKVKAPPYALPPPPPAGITLIGALVHEPRHLKTIFVALPVRHSEFGIKLTLIVYILIIYLLPSM